MRSIVFFWWLAAFIATVCAMNCATAEPIPGGAAPAGNRNGMRPLPGDEPILPTGEALRQPISLETALEWTLSHNPDLISKRQDLDVSSEAIRVARCFPTSLNPTLSVDVRPWTFYRNEDGATERLQTLVAVTLEQPIESGHRGQYRVAVARAAYGQTRWNAIQAELLALIQTYRAYQAALYRRTKLGVAGKQVEFNRHLLATLRQQLEAKQVPLSDVIIAEVESRSIDEELAVARQEYLVALVDLQQRIGAVECARFVEPVGELRAPNGISEAGEDALVRTAWGSRPEVHAARAQLDASCAAVALARAERVPIPSVGPVYEHNEAGVTFYGVAASTPLPVLNNGRADVRLREAEQRRDAVVLAQIQRRIQVEVVTSLARWNQARQSISRSDAWLEAIQTRTDRMHALYDAGEVELLKLLEVQHHLIEAESARLDVTWEAIAAHADLLAATGATPLLQSSNGMLGR